jgi:hypothetical protein
MDQIEVGDVDAQFHRGRTDHVGETAEAVALLGGVGRFPAESALAPLALARFDDLGGVFAGFEGGEGGGGVAVEALEESVDGGWCFRVAAGRGAAGVERVQGRGAAVAEAPTETGSIELEKLVVVERIEPAQKALADKQGEESVNEGGVGGWVEVELGGEKAAEFAAGAEAEAVGQALRLAFADEAVGRAEFRGAFVESPKLVKVLLGAAADLLLVCFLQTGAGDSQFAPELVEDRAHETLALGRSEGGD